MQGGAEPQNLPDPAAEGDPRKHGALVPGGAAGAGEVL